MLVYEKRSVKKKRTVNVSKEGKIKTTLIIEKFCYEKYLKRKCLKKSLKNRWQLRKPFVKKKYVITWKF